MKWLAIVLFLSVIPFLIYWYWRPARINVLAVVARIDVQPSPAGTKEYRAGVRLFERDLVASNEWWPVGTFSSLASALGAVCRFHGDRINEDNWFALMEEGRSSVLRIGDYTQELPD